MIRIKLQIPVLKAFVIFTFHKINLAHNASLNLDTVVSLSLSFQNNVRTERKNLSAASEQKKKSVYRKQARYRRQVALQELLSRNRVFGRSDQERQFCGQKVSFHGRRFYPRESGPRRGEVCENAKNRGLSEELLAFRQEVQTIRKTAHQHPRTRLACVPRTRRRHRPHWRVSSTGQKRPLQRHQNTPKRKRQVHQQSLLSKPFQCSEPNWFVCQVVCYHLHNQR